MSYCPDCGAEVSDDDNFCEQCGRELTTSSSSTGWESDDTYESTIDSQPSQSDGLGTGTHSDSPEQRTAQSSAQPTAQPGAQQQDSRWWLGVLFPTLWFVSFFAIGFVVGFITGAGVITEAEGDNILNIVGTIGTIGIGLGMIIAPVSFYKDRNHESVRGQWEPSDLYYLTVIPFLNILLGIAYWWQRRQAMSSDGETASPETARQY